MTRIPSHFLGALAASFLVFTSSVFALNAPTNGAATPAGPAAIALSWTDNAFDETGYEVQRNDGSWTTIATLAANTSHYYDRGLATESTHEYRVRAVSDSDVSAYLDLGSATTTIKMNILFFLADDMGYKDIVGLRNPDIDGATIYETPALDTLLNESLTINNAYCSGPRCVVARRSIQTGQYDWRPEVVPSGGGIALENVTYGEALQTAGYYTAFIGKYHLGESTEDPANGPAQQGYDVSIAAGHAGAPISNPTNGLAYFPDPNTLSYGLPDLGPAASADEYLTDRLTDEAIGFINDAITNHTSEPFCVTLAHYAVHTPAEAKLEDIDYFTARKTAMASELANHPMAATPLVTDQSSDVRMIQDNRVYAAMMKSYDDSLADLRTYLAATADPRNPGKTLAETTIIVVSSDHGGKSTTGSGKNKSLENDATDPVNDGSNNAYSNFPTANYPYRLGKTWVYEGGLKIPLIVYYPGVTIAGSSSEAFVHGADFFNTFVDLAGGAPSNDAVDSESFALSLGQPSASARGELQHFFTNASTGTANMAIGSYRRDDYKLLYFMIQRRVELYHLKADPYEQNDLASSRPDLAAELLAELYAEVISTGMKMPSPGSNSWQSEQENLIANNQLATLPDAPDAAPTWVGDGAVAISPTTIELNWNNNASNATHHVIYRRAPWEDSYREYAYVPADVTTFRDTNLDPAHPDGVRYRYRVESENLGGWVGYEPHASGLYTVKGATVSNGVTNTGNATVDLAGGADLPLTLTDDSITLVPGEWRTFYPLINDEGEGALTITSITQPASGTAILDGNAIHFLAPESFSGSITMTYTVEDAASQSNSATITLTLPSQATHYTAIERWDFAEASGTQLENTQSTTGLQFTGGTSSSVATDGGGNLVLTADTTNHNRNAGDVAGAPNSTGSYRLAYRVDSVDFTNSNNAVFGFSLRDGAAGIDFGVVRIRKNSGQLILEVRANNNNERIHDFGALTLSDVIVYATLNLDADPITITTSVAIGGADPVSETTVVADAGATIFDNVKFLGNLSEVVAPDSAIIDYVEVTAVEKPADLFSTWSTTYPWDGVLAQAPEDDPDGDGVSNLIEFAFGSSPTVAEPAFRPFELTYTGGAGSILFTPMRDTSELTYTVQFSDNLTDWNTLPSVVVTTPAGQQVVTNLPGGTREFVRIEVLPN